MAAAINRADALARVHKLLALADPARGGTPNERAVAKTKAGRLVAKFRFEGHELRARPSERRQRWAAPTRGPAEAWSFNPATGEASGNVKVHAYRDRSNWRIEIDPDAGRAERLKFIEQLRKR